MWGGMNIENSKNLPVRPRTIQMNRTEYKENLNEEMD